MDEENPVRSVDFRTSVKCFCYPKLKHSDCSGVCLESDGGKVTIRPTNRYGSPIDVYIQIPLDRIDELVAELYRAEGYEIIPGCALSIGDVKNAFKELGYSDELAEERARKHITPGVLNTLAETMAQRLLDNTLFMDTLTEEVRSIDEAIKEEEEAGEILFT